MKSLNHQSQVSTFTIGDLYDILLEHDYTPLRSDFKIRISNMLKILILKKEDISCGEEEWLRKTSFFISKRISHLWKITNGNVRQEDDKKFFDTVIDTSSIIYHQCFQCKPGKVFSSKSKIVNHFKKYELYHR